MSKAAPTFEEKIEVVKEYLTDDGESFLVMGFEDGSIKVLQKIGSEGETSVAKYKFCKSQKKELKKINPDLMGTTYQIGNALLEK